MYMYTYIYIYTGLTYLESTTGHVQLQCWWVHLEPAADDTAVDARVHVCEQVAHIQVEADRPLEDLLVRAVVEPRP